MDKKTTDTYYENFEKFKDDKLTKKEWDEFCLKVLDVIMEDNKDIFIRLKNNS